MAADREDRMVALVTGAAHGIGLETCRQLAERGYLVVLTARTLARAGEAVATLGSPAAMRAEGLDVADPAAASALADRLAADPGRLDVLVNNAAAMADWAESAGAADLDQARRVLDTNLLAPWRIVQAMLPLLRRSPHPRIVNVSSGAGSHGDPAFGLATGPSAASYAVSKAALNALTAKLAVELRESGILVNAVCPGLTATAPGMEAMGARPIPEGAAGVVWAATLADGGPTAGFFRDEQPLAW